MFPTTPPPFCPFSGTKQLFAEFNSLTSEQYKLSHSSPSLPLPLPQQPSIREKYVATITSVIPYLQTSILDTHYTVYIYAIHTVCQYKRQMNFWGFVSMDERLIYSITTFLNIQSMLCW